MYSAFLNFGLALEGQTGEVNWLKVRCLYGLSGHVLKLLRSQQSRHSVCLEYDGVSF